MTGIIAALTHAYLPAVAGWSLGAVIIGCYLAAVVVDVRRRRAAGLPCSALRSIIAIGGNVEAARRAGMPVNRIRISLFGGRGSTYGALLGIAVIGSINNGMYLLELDSSVRFMITAAVLLVAVIIDSLSRRDRQLPGHI